MSLVSLHLLELTVVKSSDLSRLVECEAWCTAFHLWSPQLITSLLAPEPLREGSITQGSSEKPLRQVSPAERRMLGSCLLSKFSGVTKLVTGLPHGFPPTVLPPPPTPSPADLSATVLFGGGQKVLWIKPGASYMLTE